ncbi:hypothetical protein NQ317_013958 [Molorchus minor]|uniref:Uncharacterized protein n=1 Tax=Molorchus minor TaxID=1323400 RepID=A0ABQ9JV02_9CUCU|nr:hypothetical protein NQ317_013958 [Molorchus minor]
MNVHIQAKDKQTLMSSRALYGDDAISYMQLKRDSKLCTVKCKICPEHKVHAKLYGCILVVDEEDDVILSVLCQDCAASQGGCKHAIAFLMWVHRRSEEPSCTSLECYWKKSKLSRVSSSLKYMTAKDLSKGSPILPSKSSVLLKFLAEGRKRILVEEETREQSYSSLWFELRYGRITASRAFEVSRCKTNDGTLISLILGGKIPDTPSMKRGRVLEDEVRKTVERKIEEKN